MKVGIITIFDLMNYGNRLQNYAIIVYLNKIAISSETIILNYYDIKTFVKSIISKLSRKPYYKHWNLMKEDPRYIKTLSALEREKYEKFRNFSYKYVNLRYKSYVKGAGFLLDRQYDSFITGSDQVWNPCIGQAKSWEFLCFAAPYKRNSWSASFGVKKLERQKHRFIISAWLKRMRCISVREEAGKQIVKEISGREATVLIDPTMMLDQFDWLKIAEKPKMLDCDRPYILTYFLGGRSERVNHDLNQVADQYYAQVYNLMDMEQPEVYVSGPGEFIYLIAHAKLILTDSFHACVFSFLFSKPFLVYNREGTGNGMMSRIDTLLKKFYLERKYVDSGLPNEILECDYKKGYEVLFQERQKVMDYLKRAMNIR